MNVRNINKGGGIFISSGNAAKDRRTSTILLKNIKRKAEKIKKDMDKAAAAHRAEDNQCLVK